MKNFIINRVDFIIPCLCILFCIYIVFTYNLHGIHNYLDHGFPFFFDRYLYRLLYTINDYIYLGWNNTATVSMTVSYVSLFSILEKLGFNYYILNRIEWLIALFSATYFPYLFLTSLFKRKLNAYNKLLLLLCSSFFLTSGLNTPLFITGLSQQVFALSMAPLTLWSIIRFIETKNYFYIIGVIFGSLFISSFNLPFGIIGVLLILSVILCLNNIGFRLKIKYIAIYLIIFFVVNIFWIIPFLFSIIISPPLGLNEVIQQQSNNSLKPLLESLAQRYTLADLFKLLPNYHIVIKENMENGFLFKYFTNYLFETISYLGFIIVIFVFFILKMKINNTKIMLLPILSLMLLALFLSKNINPPFGFIYLYLFDHSTFFKMFRDTIKFFIFYYFYLMIFFSIIIVNLKRSILKSLTITVVAIFLIPWFFLLFGRFKSYNVPEYYFKFDKDINKLSKNTDRALILDSLESYNKFDFDNTRPMGTSNILKYISPIATIDLFSPGGGVSFNYVTKLLEKIKKDDRDLKIFQEAGINYLFFQGDNLRHKDYKYSSKYFDFITYGKLTIYKLKQDYIKPVLSIRTDKESKTKVIFKKISPVEYHVSLLNLDKEVSIELLNTYDKEWRIYSSPKKLDCDTDIFLYKSYHTGECINNNSKFNLININKLWQKNYFYSSHKVAYNFANKWKVNKKEIISNKLENIDINPDGSLNINLVIYHRTQAINNLSIIFSILAIILSVLIIIIKQSIIRKNNGKK